MDDNMTEAEARLLGERWIHAGGGWAEGMLAWRPGDFNSRPCRVQVDPSRAGLGWPGEGGTWCTVTGDEVPDVRDHATRGCMYALAAGQSATGLPGVRNAAQSESEWARAEAEAIVAAMEASR